MPQRVTAQTARLLEVMLSDPSRDWYGLELMDLADLHSGTAYPLLHRLQEEEWLSSTREQIDPSAAGRPRRRLYRLTGIGQVGAEQALARREQRSVARPPGSKLRPAGATA
jgi:PadR family transcriptional regulator